ncbi:Nucleoside-diphosphate-sugar epimerase [Flavobacterium segetis]|uniref:Nucleoside-diphosphate-sugar epimerase n=1 Tax=Flavobacterium segetis TaxID=271157 RepID=A0A1M5FV28_9FLAO|nr:NAD-dependent epimerase/dehydratase family protein [Flavobacterium segetis]SHF95326.1 Nucleoside-diphosphate-sugar epimerase [Flavobacterium segetis]
MILITGGTGLVGAHLLLHLIKNGEQVRAIYRKPESIEKTKSLFDLYKKRGLFDLINWYPADINNIPALEKAFEGIDYVYHCAAVISLDPKDENLLRKTNIEGTANIVNFCIAFNIKKLCFISSIATLGDLLPHEKFITEETEWNPENYHSDYAISKYGAEMEIWRGQQEGLSTLIINPGVILGPGFREQGSGLLFQKVEEGLTFYTLGTTGFISVIDVVKLTIDLMKSDISNQRFTLVSENISFKEILFTIADALKVKRPKTEASKLLMELIWRIDYLLSALFGKKRQFTKATARASYSQSLYSNQKVKDTLPNQFTNIRLYIKEIARLKN